MKHSSSFSLIFLEDTQSIGAADPCSPNPCKNNGVCSLVGNKPTCQCAQGFFGDYCQGNSIRELGLHFCITSHVQKKLGTANTE